MRPETNKLLFDIGRAAENLSKFVGGRTFDEFTTNVMLRSACERQLEIIGEAMGRLRELDDATFALFTDGAKIVGLRHRLIHGYDAVNSKIVWDVIQQKLSTLRDELQRARG